MISSFCVVQECFIVPAFSTARTLADMYLSQTESWSIGSSHIRPKFGVMNHFPLISPEPRVYRLGQALLSQLYSLVADNSNNDAISAAKTTATGLVQVHAVY